MEKEIIKVLKYFSFFAYYPTLDEIYTFLPVKIDKNKLKYTPPQYSIRRKISENKLNNWRFRAYVKLISLFPQIKLVGLSGSISMFNAKEEDDIDLFIITAKNRLFTGRLIALFFAQILGLRRTSPQSLVPSPSKNKVCLNLFFDESNLKVPHFKQTLFVGHEVLQMKPIVVKGDIYERFLKVNEWVFGIFPNASHVIPAPDRSRGQAPAGIQTKISWIPVFTGMTCLLKIKNLGDWVESQLKRFQLRLINKHKTTEIITPTQLWFHPNDYNSFM